MTGGVELASSLGLKVGASERGRVGASEGTACVPFNALLASAKAAHTMRHARPLLSIAVQQLVAQGAYERAKRLKFLIRSGR